MLTCVTIGMFLLPLSFYILCKLCKLENVRIMTREEKGQYGNNEIYENLVKVPLTAKCSAVLSYVNCTPTNEINLKELLALFPKPSYIQVGAHTGVSNSDPLGFLRSHAFGLLVEPVSSNFDKLKLNFRTAISVGLLRVYNVAMCPTLGLLEMFAIEGPKKIVNRLPDYASQIASLDKAHLLKARDRILQKSGVDIAPFIVGRNVSCQTFDRLIDENFEVLKNLRLVVIDAEGHDGRLVRQLVEADICPSLLVYESAHLTPPELSETRELLQEQGYYVHRYSKMDHLAVRCKK